MDDGVKTVPRYLLGCQRFTTLFEEPQMNQSQTTYNRSHVRQALGKWSQIVDDPSITLWGVYRLIDRALDQSAPLSSLPVACLLGDLPEPLASWFKLWDEESEEMHETVGYWQANLEEDLQNVEELIEDLGADFLFAEL